MGGSKGSFTALVPPRRRHSRLEPLAAFLLGGKTHCLGRLKKVHHDCWSLKHHSNEINTIKLHSLALAGSLLFLHYNLFFKGSKQKVQVQNTSLMHSESELDSDDAIFTWPDREKGKLLRNQNGFLRNGQAMQKTKNQREAIL